MYIPGSGGSSLVALNTTTDRPLVVCGACAISLFLTCSAVIAFNELMLDDYIPISLRKDYCRSALSSAEALLGVIDNILDFTRFEGNAVHLDEEDFDLMSIVANLGDVVSPKAHRKGIELVFDVDMGVPPLLRGDFFRFRQVLINLVDNGIKFTESGGYVILRVFLATLEDFPGNGHGHAPLDRGQGDEHCFFPVDEHGKLYLFFEVEDNGIGIEPSKQGMLFKPFSQVQLSNTRRFGGSGLGLAICKKIIMVVPLLSNSSLRHSCCCLHDAIVLLISWNLEPAGCHGRES